VDVQTSDADDERDDHQERTRDGMPQHAADYGNRDTRVSCKEIAKFSH